MIRSLIILLLIVGCEEPAIEGCMDTTACNYNADANIFDDSCEEIDDCGVCGGDGAVFIEECSEVYHCTDYKEQNCEFVTECLSGYECP